ncbi:MAG TPA: hypothetical protein PKD55_16815 [Bellilinea sp.]|nr:hypothetical protein [Bellilinea sp.]
MINYRILSLDGGGTWALIQVKALMKLFGEDARGRDVLRKFDLAEPATVLPSCGDSGSAVAVAL